MEHERLDLTSEPNTNSLSGAGPDRPAATQRPYLGVRFSCCGVYARIYRNREATAYVGHCPRCSKPVRVRIGPGGGSGRFFEA